MTALPLPSKRGICFSRLIGPPAAQSGARPEECETRSQHTTTSRPAEIVGNVPRNGPQFHLYCCSVGHARDLVRRCQERGGVRNRKEPVLFKINAPKAMSTTRPAIDDTGVGATHIGLQPLTAYSLPTCSLIGSWMEPLSAQRATSNASAQRCMNRFRAGNTSAATQRIGILAVRTNPRIRRIYHLDL